MVMVEKKEIDAFWQVVAFNKVEERVKTTYFFITRMHVWPDVNFNPCAVTLNGSEDRVINAKLEYVRCATSWTQL